MYSRVVLIQIILMLGITVHHALSATCPDPSVIDPYCSCTALSYGLKLECDGFETSEQIKMLFSRPSLFRAIVAEVYFYDLNVSLPSAVFDTVQVQDLTVECGGNSLHVAPDAFPRQQTRRLSLSYCDVTETDFTFLEGFGRINELYVAYSRSDRFLNFPKATTLTTLKIIDTPLSQWLPMGSVPNLSRLHLEKLGKEHVKTLMKEIVKETFLTVIELPSNGLDTIPKELGQMSQLKEVNLEFNPISSLRNQSLHFTAALTFLSFNACPLTHIEIDAFKGNFSNTHLKLSRTKLQVFEELVFKPLLEMKFRNKGYIELSETEFKCDCSLSWLITENRRFLSHVRDGHCLTSGTPFEELIPEDLEQCQTTTPRVTTTAETEAGSTTKSTVPATEETTVSTTGATTEMSPTTETSHTSTDGTISTRSTTESPTSVVTETSVATEATTTALLTSTVSDATTTLSTPTVTDATTRDEPVTTSPSSTTSVSTVTGETVTTTSSAPPTADTTPTVSTASTTPENTPTSTVTGSTTTAELTTTSTTTMASTSSSGEETTLSTMTSTTTMPETPTTITTISTTTSDTTTSTVDATTIGTTTSSVTSTSAPTDMTTLTVTDSTLSATSSTTTPTASSTIPSTTSTEVGTSTSSTTVETTISSTMSTTTIETSTDATTTAEATTISTTRSTTQSTVSPTTATTPSSTSTISTTRPPVPTTTIRISTTTPSSASGTTVTVVTILLAVCTAHILK